MAEESFSRVARSLAESVSPEEEELAPLLASAYAEGKLKAGTSAEVAVLGGFVGGSETSLFLNVIDCIAACGGILSSALALRVHRFDLRGRKHEAKAELRSASGDLDQAVAALARLLTQRGMSPQQADTVSLRAVTALLVQGNDGHSFVQRVTAAP